MNHDAVNGAEAGNETARLPLELSGDNIDAYIAKAVLPELPSGTAVTEISEITENSYVNWVFAVGLEHSDTKGIETIYIRQSRDHVKQYPDMARSVVRTETEARALRFVNSIAPNTVPNVIFFDKPNSTLVLSDVKLGGNLLADELANGRVHPETGISFGGIIGRIQARTVDKSLTEILGDGTAEPAAHSMSDYLGLRAARAKDLASEVTDILLSAGEHAPTTFVLGDLASKNIFVEGNNLRFLDLERVFVGDPAYDPAYLFCHFLIEAKGEHTTEYVLDFIDNFMTSYLTELREVFTPDQLASLQNRVVGFLGMSILHRTQGTHFVSYVGEDKDLWQERAVKLLDSGAVQTVTEAVKSVMI